MNMLPITAQIAPAATATATEVIVKTTNLEDRALALLGSGIPAESVAAALGVSASRISQLLSQEEFAAQVSALRYENLQQHNHRDGKYDSLEDKLIEKLEHSLPLMLRPAEILAAIRIVNGAKRRGQSAPEQITQTTRVVNLVLPTQITQHFTTNINNQVTKAGEQELLTLSSGNLIKEIEERESDDSQDTPSTDSTDTDSD